MDRAWTAAGRRPDPGRVGGSWASGGARVDPWLSRPVPVRLPAVHSSGVLALECPLGSRRIDLFSGGVPGWAGVGARRGSAPRSLLWLGQVDGWPGVLTGSGWKARGGCFPLPRAFCSWLGWTFLQPEGWGVICIMHLIGGPVRLGGFLGLQSDWANSPIRYIM